MPVLKMRELQLERPRARSFYSQDDCFILVVNCCGMLLNNPVRVAHITFLMIDVSHREQRKYEQRERLYI